MRHALLPSRRFAALLIPALLGLLCSACATSRRFAPRENQNGTGPSGWPAAVYPLAGGTPGEVRLWSDGAERVDAPDGQEVTRLHVGFELENTGAEPLLLDLPAVRLRLPGSASAADGIAPLHVTGQPEAKAGTTVRVDLLFDPGAVMPREIPGFDLHWTVIAGNRPMAQVTPFLPFVPEPPPSWYWGYGYGWGYGCGAYSFFCH